ncbi:hypothetical protein BGZ63DRAFT_72482 [Mariannaea sp. PMI_226]|nr:hypothetical protein BGZ63DRAFT_72482 [Mariannaea sp. PMI_226]
MKKRPWVSSCRLVLLKPPVPCPPLAPFLMIPSRGSFFPSISLFLSHLYPLTPLGRACRAFVALSLVSHVYSGHCFGQSLFYTLLACFASISKLPVPLLISFFTSTIFPHSLFFILISSLFLFLSLFPFSGNWIRLQTPRFSLSNKRRVAKHITSLAITRFLTTFQSAPAPAYTLTLLDTKLVLNLLFTRPTLHSNHSIIFSSGEIFSLANAILPRCLIIFDLPS